MKVFFFATLAATAILMSSCNTFIGLGRDMKIAGEGMEKVGNKASGGDRGDSSGAPIY
jgi:predicted small secreted protein